MTAEEVLARLEVRVRQEIALLTGEHLKNLKSWRVRDAIVLTSFYREQAHMCADSLAVLYKVREDRFQ